jgi:hypothetical protein
MSRLNDMSDEELYAILAMVWSLMLGDRALGRVDGRFDQDNRKHVSRADSRALFKQAHCTSALFVAVAFATSGVHSVV